MTIDQYIRAEEVIENFKIFCDKYNLEYDVSTYCSYADHDNGESRYRFRVSNKGGMFYHDLYTLDDIKSMQNAFALGREFEQLKGENNEQ